MIALLIIAGFAAVVLIIAYLFACAMHDRYLAAVDARDAAGRQPSDSEWLAELRQAAPRAGLIDRYERLFGDDDETVLFPAATVPGEVTR